ncbi:MAG: hypothetical protein ACYTF6_08985 [Planctomycetota bacterium]|jgi:hypothetical protein
MGDPDQLYAELKPEIQSLAEPLFGASEALVRKRGSFLPHGAVLTEQGETRLIMAGTEGFEGRSVSSIEVLPALHEALRATAREGGVRAVAVCEDVTITPEGQKKTRAIKVLVEHQRGLCVGLYLPYRRKILGAYVFGDVFARSATPEVLAWKI